MDTFEYWFFKDIEFLPYLPLSIIICIVFYLAILNLIKSSAVTRNNHISFNKNDFNILGIDQNQPELKESPALAEEATRKYLHKRNLFILQIRARLNDFTRNDSLAAGKYVSLKNLGLLLQRDAYNLLNAGNLKKEEYNDLLLDFIESLNRFVTTAKQQHDPHIQDSILTPLGNIYLEFKKVEQAYKKLAPTTYEESLTIF